MGLYHHLMLLQGLAYFVHFGLRVILPFILIEDQQLTELSAIEIYTAFCSLAYVSSLFAGYMGDRWIAPHRLLIAGFLQLAVGSLGFCFSPYWLLSLAMMSLAHGTSVVSLSVLLGQLRSKDLVKDSLPYQSLFIACCIGTFLGMILVGVLGAFYPWSFCLAILALIASLSVCVACKLGYSHHWLSCNVSVSHCYPKVILSFVLFLCMALMVMLSSKAFLTMIIIIMALLTLFFAYHVRSTYMNSQVVMALAYLLLLVVLFDGFFEQFAAAFNVFIDKHVNRQIGGLTFPSQWLLALNPLFVFMLCPCLRYFSFSKNFRYGLAFSFVTVGLGFFIIASGGLFSLHANTNMYIGWFIVAILLFTLGESVLIPTAQSFFADCAPETMKSQLMGLWWLTPAIAHYLSSHIATSLASSWNKIDNHDSLVAFALTNTKLGLWTCLIVLVVLLNRRLLMKAQAHR